MVKQNRHLALEPGSDLSLGCKEICKAARKEDISVPVQSLVVESGSDLSERDEQSFSGVIAHQVDLNLEAEEVEGPDGRSVQFVSVNKDDMSPVQALQLIFEDSQEVSVQFDQPTSQPVVLCRKKSVNSLKF